MKLEQVSLGIDLYTKLSFIQWWLSVGCICCNFHWYTHSFSEWNGRLNNVEFNKLNRICFYVWIVYRGTWLRSFWKNKEANIVYILRISRWIQILVIPISEDSRSRPGFRVFAPWDPGSVLDMLIIYTRPDSFPGFGYVDPDSGFGYLATWYGCLWYFCMTGWFRGAAEWSLYFLAIKIYFCPGS